jgi:hypothetical protein
MDHEIAFALRRGRQREACAECRGDFGAARLDIDQRHLRAGNPSGEPRAQRTDHAGAHDGDAVRRTGCRVPHGVERGLHVGGEHPARRRQVRGQQRHRVRCEVERRLMREEHETDAADEIGRPSFDAGDGGVAVFHREREGARHVGRAHAGMLARGNPPVEHQPFGAPADPAVKGPQAQLACGRRRERLGADFGAAGADIPQRLALNRVLVHRTDPSLDSETPEPLYFAPRSIPSDLFMPQPDAGRPPLPDTRAAEAPPCSIG